MKIQTTLATAAAALFVLTGCSTASETSLDSSLQSDSDQALTYVDPVTDANRTLVESTCTSVTSAYDDWVARNVSSKTPTGKVARDGLIYTLAEAIDTLKTILSEDEIKAGQQELGDVDYGYSAAAVAAGMINLNNTIYNQEHGFAPYWTAGSYTTIDQVYENAVKEPCGSLSGSQAALDSAAAAPAIEAAERTAIRYPDIRSLTDALKVADSSICTKEKPDGDWHMICSNSKGIFTANLFLFNADASEDFVYSTPDRTYPDSVEIYGPNWSVTVSNEAVADLDAIASAIGGIVYR